MSKASRAQAKVMFPDHAAAPADAQGASTDLELPVATTPSSTTPGSAATDASSSPFVINIVYDSSVTALDTEGNAAYDPTLYAEYTQAAQTAVDFYQSAFTNPMTVTIDFGYGEVGGSTITAGNLGESYAVTTLGDTYSEVYNALAATDTTSAVQIAAVASLPTTDPTDGASFNVPIAEATALGLLGSDDAYVGAVGLSSTSDFNWDRTDIGSDQYDAIGTFEHEISEVLGRSDTGGADDIYHPLDLFRYTAANGSPGDAPGAEAGARDEPFVAGYSAHAYSYFSYNGQTITLQYDTPKDDAEGADIGDWAPRVHGDSYGYGDLGVASLVSATDLDEMNVLGYDIACFRRGTRILTVRGEIAVEDLSVGDRVITSARATRPIRWLGCRTVACDRHPEPARAWPVRVAAGAFGNHLPLRDLWLSPAHAIVAEQVLIPVGSLLNGVTVTQHQLPTVQYWHIELDRHDIIVADGLPAETYLDCGNRSAFENDGAIIDLHPDLRPHLAAGFCLPFLSAGPTVDRARAALMARAPALGFTETPDAALHLTSGETRIDPIVLAPDRFAFILPPAAAELRLISRSFMPSAAEGGSADVRTLGVCVRRLQIDGTDVPLDQTSVFGAGWHDPEWGDPGTGRCWRWTDGHATLPPGIRLLVLDVAGVGKYWVRDETRAWPLLASVEARRSQS